MLKFSLNFLHDGREVIGAASISKASFQKFQKILRKFAISESVESPLIMLDFQKYFQTLFTAF